MLETYSYTAPARVKTLVVPIDGLSMEQFESYYNSSLSKYYEVRLVDVTPNSGLFNPQGYPHGRVIYDYQLVPPDLESLFLQDFEPFRKCFNVLGLASHSNEININEKLSQLKKQHTSAINHNIVVFDTPDDIIDTLPSHKNIFHLSKSQNITALETILCDITSNFLESLSAYASSYQHVTLRSPGTVGSTEVSSSSPTLKRSVSSGLTNGHSSPASYIKNASSSALGQEKLKKRITSASFLPTFENSSAGLNQERLKQSKNKGRQQKIFGNFYLLSGRLSDSLKEFCDAIVLLKASNDHLWLASALDGLGVCIMMLTFLEVPFQLPPSVTSILTTGGFNSNSTNEIVTLSPSSSPRNSTTSNTRNSVASLTRVLSNQMNGSSSPASHSQQHSSNSTSSAPEANASYVTELICQLTSNAISFYRSTFDYIEDYVPQIVYCETVLRYVKLVTLIHINTKLDFNLMKHIVKSVPLSSRPSTISEKGSFSSIIDKSAITQIESEIFTPHFNKLDFIHKARIYSCLISVATDLQLYRRRTFLLKELFDLISPRLNDKTAEINTSLSSISQRDGVSVEYARNAKAILGLLDEMLISYGIVMNPLDDSGGQFFPPNWIELHLITLKKFVDLTERLGFIEASMKYGSILLKGYSFVLTTQEQLSILNKIKEQVNQLRLIGTKFELHYWDDFLARDVSSLPVVSDLTPIKQNKALSNPETFHAKTDIYNPFSSAKDIQIELVTLVQNEPSDILVTLQNPFAFDIDVKNLEVVCSNSFKIRTTQFFPAIQQPQQQETQTDLIIVRPGQLVDVFVTIVPLQFGDLEIIGIKAEVCDCSPRVFKISVSKDFKVHEKIKHTGIRSFEKINEPSVLYQNDYTSLIEKSLKYHVLSPQPVLSLIDTSLLNNSVMLLEGEIKTFSIKLQNNSPVTINHLTSVFFDSTTEPLKKALTSKLPPNEVYEIEYYLLKKVPFNIINREELAMINGNQMFTIEISLLGKRGMSYGSIMLEYSNVMDGKSLEYIRRIDVPINISVYPSIEIASCDIIPIFSSGEIFDDNTQLLEKTGRGSFWNFLNKRVSKGEKLTDYCLLLLDLRNCWSGDLSIDLTSSATALSDDDMLPVMDHDNSEDCSIKDTIGNGKTERFLIPIKRIRFSESLLSSPIPSLRSKQFIVDSTTPKEEQKFIREAFWYRQELLKHIQGSWQTTGVDSVKGDIELRGVRLSSKMLGILKVDSIEIHHSLYLDDEPVRQSDKITYNLVLQEFYTLKTTITNKSSQPVSGMFRHIPMSKSTNVSIDRKILYNGVLQYHLPRELNANESMELELTICILESGEYEWGTIFDEMVSDGMGNIEEKESHTQRGSLFINAS